VLSVRGGDGEGLLRQTIGLVAVAVRSSVRIALVPLHAIAVGSLVKVAASTLALHFTVCEEAPRDPTGAPRLAIRPPAHARFSLIPHEDGARLDGMSLLLGQASLYSRQKSDAACLEQNDGVRGGSHVTVVRLHSLKEAVRKFATV